MSNQQDEVLVIALRVTSALATLSFVSLVGLFVYLIWHLCRINRTLSYILANYQVPILIMNLLVADMMAAMGFGLSGLWARYGGPGPVGPNFPTSACQAQAWLMSIGDEAHAIFTAAIAVHTFGVLILRRGICSKALLALIGIAWVVVLAFPIIGRLVRGEQYFLSLGPWCWISRKWIFDRLWAHYFVIFICQFITVVLYSSMIIYLALHSRASRRSFSQSLSRAALYMALYPLVYLLTCLPLTVLRMITIAGGTITSYHFVIAGSVFVSSGWLDVLLYSVTRKSIWQIGNRERLEDLLCSGVTEDSAVSTYAIDIEMKQTYHMVRQLSIASIEH